MEEKVMELVKEICEMESTDCRSLNKSEPARKLLDLAGVPKSAKIGEILFCWGNQASVLFSLPNDNNYYCLFAGLGCTDKKFYFDLSINSVHGTLDVDSMLLEDNVVVIDYDDDGFPLPIDYFKTTYKAGE